MATKRKVNGHRPAATAQDPIERVSCSEFKLAQPRSLRALKLPPSATALLVSDALGLVTPEFGAITSDLEVVIVDDLVFPRAASTLGALARAQLRSGGPGVLLHPIRNDRIGVIAERENAFAPEDRSHPFYVRRHPNGTTTLYLRKPDGEDADWETDLVEDIRNGLAIARLLERNAAEPEHALPDWFIAGLAYRFRTDDQVPPHFAALFTETKAPASWDELHDPRSIAQLDLRLTFTGVAVALWYLHHDYGSGDLLDGNFDPPLEDVVHHLNQLAP